MTPIKSWTTSCNGLLCSWVSAPSAFGLTELSKDLEYLLKSFVRNNVSLPAIQRGSRSTGDVWACFAGPPAPDAPRLLVVKVSYLIKTWQGNTDAEVRHPLA